MKTILVVDDDAMNLKMAEFILQKKNYKVILAESGFDALCRLKEFSVDLILLDIEMPQMNGFQTLEKIKEDSEIKDIPVMFLSASFDEADIDRALRMGALDYVKKPFLPQLLEEQVEKVLGNSTC
ncbi:MAG: PleD family two-component system response regulator [Lachnospiraceae bacterium]